MADAVTNFSALSNDAPNVYIARETYRLAERNLRIGKYAKLHQVPQRMGKTLRIVRYKRLNLPLVGGTLTEGTPPDAVALATENVDVTLEQWGIVVLLTDVAEITTVHPALQIAIDRTALAMAEVLEREQANMLMAGTQVFYATGVANRAALDGTKKAGTSDVLGITVALRNQGAAEDEGGLFSGVMPPQVEGDIISADATFKDASNFANVRKLEFGEIGIWMGTRWARGNFLPIFKGQSTPDTMAVSGTLAAGDAKPLVTAIDGGGSIVSATNFKFAVVWRDKTSDYERHISQTSANIMSAATGNNESFTIGVPASSITNYVYDVYMTVAGGSGSLFKVLSRQSTATSAVITAVPAGTETTLPSAPAAAKEVFVSWVFGKDSFGRVELNGMSLQSYITPPGASYSNPLAQGRKVGSKIMWKSFIIDNNFFARLESNSAYSAGLPS
jgi:N4-gp56 family major capsid protein